MVADRTLFGLVATLIGIGIILVYSLAGYATILNGVDEFNYAIKQLVFGLGGIVLMWIIAQLNPQKHLNFIGFSLFFVSIALMITMPFMPESLVASVGGAKRWIKIAGFSLAPVEFFKIGFIYFLAWSFSRKLGYHDGMGVVNEFKRFFPYALVFATLMFIIAFIQNDLGQVAVLSFTLLFMLTLAGSSAKFFMLIISGVFMLLISFIFSAEHRIKRLLSWWANVQDMVLDIFPPSWAQKLRVASSEEPYQIGHSLNAIHNGGIFGTGLGNGSFKLGFLSDVHTDFILAGLAEEFGFIGIFVVVTLFLWMIQRIFKIANRVEDAKVYLFSIGMGLLLAFTFLVNSYGISGITPIKGIAVPFLSYGGSSIFASCIGIGMILMSSKLMPKGTKL